MSRVTSVPPGFKTRWASVKNSCQIGNVAQNESGHDAVENAGSKWREKSAALNELGLPSARRALFLPLREPQHLKREIETDHAGAATATFGGRKGEIAGSSAEIQNQTGAASQNRGNGCFAPVAIEPETDDPVK